VLALAGGGAQLRAAQPSAAVQPSQLQRDVAHALAQAGVATVAECAAENSFFSSFLSLFFPFPLLLIGGKSVKLGSL